MIKLIFEDGTEQLLVMVAPFEYLKKHYLEEVKAIDYFEGNTLVKQLKIVDVQQL